MVLTMLVGAALLFAGFMGGRYIPRPRPKPPKPTGPMCGCEHARAFHDLAKGSCHREIEIPLERNSEEFVTRWERQQCPCRQYDGPEKLPTYYAPEVTS